MASCSDALKQACVRSTQKLLRFPFLVDPCPFPGLESDRNVLGMVAEGVEEAGLGRSSLEAACFEQKLVN